MTSPGASETLPLTGERTVPGIPEENYWFRRHEVVYEVIAGRCAGAVVLEAGCGEGYGADLLGRTAAHVLALDYDAHTAGHVARRYPGLSTLRGNLAALPVADGAVDVVVNLQVIEHLWDQAGFLAECARVLRPGGTLLVSTPNRTTFSPGRDTPLNPFHTRELDGAELVELVEGAGLVVDRLAGVHHGPRLAELDAAHGGSFVDAQLTRSLAGEPWPAALHAEVAGITTADFAVLAATEADVDASLDLLVVATRPTDRAGTPGG